MINPAAIVTPKISCKSSDVVQFSVLIYRDSQGKWTDADQPKIWVKKERDR